MCYVKMWICLISFAVAGEYIHSILDIGLVGAEAQRTRGLARQLKREHARARHLAQAQHTVNVAQVHLYEMSVGGGGCIYSK